MQARRSVILAVCTLLAAPAFLFAQSGQATAGTPAAKPAPSSYTPAESMGALLSLTESEVVSAAEAMPADKYDFVPPATSGEFKTVRSFGGQVKHLAQANYQLLRGSGVPGALDPKTLEDLKTKDDLVKALKDSYTYAHAVANALTTDNAFSSVPNLPPNWKITRTSDLAFMIMHTMDHYGQMCVYLRMNGIIPPASRPGAM
jgi:uncharacterized damage-inducible protein DinB